MGGLCPWSLDALFHIDWVLGGMIPLRIASPQRKEADMAEFTISMTPQELRDGVTTLQSQTNDLLDVLSNMNGTIEDVCANWQGEAMGAFKETWDEIYSELTESLTNTLEGIEGLMSGAAESLESADEDIASAMSL